ncbi:MAG: translocation/assembly module TamB [Candidatus Symbiothrix sp.]|jgi:autotransporter translocation and assembly factor TamB|nr:translocation/assembly module TamB [Candidatus Symbiothrix sp.]
MKRLNSSIWLIVIVIGILILLPVILLKIPAIQQHTAQLVVHYLEEKTKTEIQIQAIEFQPFNKLILKNVYVADLTGDTLLYAKRFDAGFDLWPMFKNKYRIRSAHLNSFCFYLNKKDSLLNIQFLLDAFRTDTTQESKVDIHIQNLSFHNGQIRYRDKNKSNPSGKFNPDDMDWQDIIAKIQFKELKDQRLDVVVKKMSAKEKSGLQVNRLAFDLVVNSDSARIQNLELKLPHTKLHLTELSADYSRLPADGNWKDNALFNIQIEPSTVLLKDLAAFAPDLGNFNEVLEIQAAARGTVNDIQLKNILIKDDNDLKISLNLQLRDALSHPTVLGVIDHSFITAVEIQKMANNFSAQPVKLPDFIQALGTVSLQGQISGTPEHLTASLKNISDIGDLNTNINFGKRGKYFLNGTIATSGIQLNKVFNDEDFGATQFNIDLNSTFNTIHDIAGHVEASVNQFAYQSNNYENIHFNGDFTSESFNGWLKVSAPVGELTANGYVLLKGEASEYHFSAQASDWLLDKLHFTGRYHQPKLSFQVEADFKGNSPDNLIGYTTFQKAVFSTDKGVFHLANLTAEISQPSPDILKQISIRSDIVNGTINGIFSLKTLPETLKRSLAFYLPTLIPSEEPKAVADENHLQWNFTINDTRQLSHILELPAVLYGQSYINGAYSSINDQMRLNARFATLDAAGSTFENGALDLNTGNGYISLKVNGKKRQKNGNNLLLEANVKTTNDSIYSWMSWLDDHKKYKGNLYFTTQLKAQTGEYPMTVATNFRASKMVFNDSVWNLAPTSIRYQDGRISIHHFKAGHNQQWITINGEVSPQEDDRIAVTLNKVDLDYIFKALNIKALTFGGIATGEVTAKDVYHTRQLSTRLNISDFSFNDMIFGNLDLHGRWDDEKQGVEMKGIVAKNEASFVDIDGYIYPVKKELSIVFGAHNTQANFLRKYVGNVVKDLSGEITGNIRLFGDLNDPVIEGNPWIQNGSFGIEFLNTRYSFSDRLLLKPDEIALNNITLYDSFGNKSIASGSVKHHLFEDFRFLAQLSFKQFMVFNATHRNSPNFYGTAFGTGTATISGTEESVGIQVNMRNDDHTELELNFMKKQDIADYNFINFVSEERPAPVAKPAKANPSGLKTDIRLNLMVDATNTAAMNIIMDPVTEDKISAKGTGNIQIQYGTKTPLKVFGNYRIEEGKYNFSFQQAFFRNFEIEEGSSVNFRGDPLTADLAIKAAYTVSANLGDLDQQLIQASEARLSARNNIPVNCVLLLSGPLEQPLIKFDLELPGATAELERQVKSYIRTDDMMSRQMIYLLLMGRFYTSPEYVKSDNGHINNDFSMLASTLSSSITNMLSKVSNNIQVGTNFHQSYEGEETNTEVELLLSSTLLNNRLVINGNVGYIDNPYLTAINNEVPLIGDFDFEYKLTKSGDIRLKGFNHYNYRNYSLTPEMTQGFGILFRKDFNLWKDFFPYQTNKK